MRSVLQEVSEWKENCDELIQEFRSLKLDNLVRRKNIEENRYICNKIA